MKYWKWTDRHVNPSRFSDSECTMRFCGSLYCKKQCYHVSVTELIGFGVNYKARGIKLNFFTIVGGDEGESGDWFLLSGSSEIEISFTISVLCKITVFITYRFLQYFIVFGWFLILEIDVGNADFSDWVWLGILRFIGEELKDIEFATF